MKNRTFQIFALCKIAWIVGAGCSLPERHVEMSLRERNDREQALGDRWAREIQGVVRTREDTVLEVRMQELSARLGLLVRPKILFFSAATAKMISPVFVLPGQRWYFSSRALQGLRYDNELVAAIAAAQGLSERVEQSLVPGILESMSSEATLAVPVYSDSDWRMVNARMVNLLYQAGYDPRGVPQFWKKADSAWVGMPPDWGLLLQEEAHAFISRKVPLLNPVVRTPEFGEIEKRLRKL